MVTPVRIRVNGIILYIYFSSLKVKNKPNEGAT
jgi:hypothetical protein